MGTHDYSVMDQPEPVLMRLQHEIRYPYYNYERSYAFGYGDSDKARGLCGAVIEAHKDYALISFTGEVIRDDTKVNGYILARVVLHNGDEGVIYAKPYSGGRTS